MAFVKSTLALLLLGVLLGGIWEKSESRTVKTESEVDGNFQLICNVSFEAGGVPVLKYRSSKSGMQVYVAQLEGPIVQGVITLPTEPNDDDGLPHALEHLVFKGSEKYPYTSALDLFANWNNAQGVNAYTTTDHTAYSVNTAGKDGFFNILPVYLDHILNPLLKNESYITEVYHITKDGEDAGVVYSEVQGRENSRSTLMFSAMSRILYPAPNGYRYSIAGYQETLRKSLTYDKIKEYHKKFYRPEFMHMTVTGKVNAKEVFDVLNSFEAEQTNEVNDNVTKAWSGEFPPFVKSEDQKVFYSSQSEESGSVWFAWRGPDAENILEMQCVSILMMYLTSLSISPLTKAFTEDSELANSVYSYVGMYHSSFILIELSGVEKEKLAEIKPHFLTTMNNISSQPEFFDRDLVETIINNEIVRIENSIEEYSHETLISYINKDILFGKNCDFLDKVLNVKKHYEEMKTRKATFWIDLMKKYLIDTPMATVIGIPSKEEAERIKEENKARIAKRKLELGEETLRDLGETVKNANKINEIPLPTSILESVAVPSMENLSFHSLTPYTNIENHESGIIPAKFPNVINLKSIPYKLSISDVNSKAVHITAIVDHSELTASENFYIPLLKKLLLSSPIVENCKLIPAADVIRQIYSDLNYATISDGPNMFTMKIEINAQKRKFSKAMEWLNNILFRVHLDQKRVSLKTNQLLTSYKKQKESDSGRMRIIMDDLLLRKGTPETASNFLRQEKFLRDLKVKLKNNPTSVLDKLKMIYKKITFVSNLLIHVSANVQELDSVRDIESTMKNFAVNSDTCLKNFRMKDLANWKGMANFSAISGKAVVHGMDSIESSTLKQVTTTFTSYSDCNFPALLAVIQYFSQFEGPMWKAVRGNGLAYSCGMYSDIGSGLLYLSFYSASQLTKAYEAARDVINSHLNGSTKWDHHLLEAAKSSLMYSLASSESEISKLSWLSMDSYYRKVPFDNNRKLIRKVRKVTMEEVQAIAQKYLRKLVDPLESLLVTVCPTNKVNETSELLSRLNFNVEVLDDIENSRFGQ